MPSDAYVDTTQLISAIFSEVWELESLQSAEVNEWAKLQL